MDGYVFDPVNFTVAEKITVDRFVVEAYDNRTETETSLMMLMTSDCKETSRSKAMGICRNLGYLFIDMSDPLTVEFDLNNLPK